MSKCKCALSLLNAMNWYQEFSAHLGGPDKIEKQYQTGLITKEEHDDELHIISLEKQLLIGGINSLGQHCDVNVDSLKEVLNALTIPGVPTTPTEFDEEVGFKIVKLVEDCAKEEI